MEAKDQINEVIKELGLEFKFTFVPFSKSRNAKPVKSPSDLSLNWVVNIVRRTGSEGEDRYRFIETDYQQGIGHIPDYKFSSRITSFEFSRLKAICETGKLHRNESLAFERPLPEPKSYDVLHCLALDADVINYRNYEDWAADLGYDPDSRKGEAVYQACLKIALELRALIGDAAIQKIREAEL